MTDAGGLHLELSRIWKGKRKRKLIEADDLNRIELLVDRALDHFGDQRSADTGGAVDIYVQYFYPADELLRIAVKLQIDVRFGVAGKIDATDQRHVLAAGKGDRSVNLAVAKTDGGTDGFVFAE